MLYIPTLFLSLFITITLIPIFRTLAMKANVVDMPNDRKVHKKPIPKIGGVAFAFGALIPILFLGDFFPIDRFTLSVMIGAWIIVLFGFLDDIKDLGYKAKFFGQVVATLIVIFLGDLTINNMGDLLLNGFLLPGVIAIPLTLITIIGVTNAINLADGLDGLAGGISLLSFLCIGYLAYISDLTCIAVMSAAMVGGLFGFLRFNTYPATIFMGDAGSQLIGFLAVTLSLKLTQGNTPLSPVLPLMLLGFPVLDTLVVMTERRLKGRSMFVADKNHFHHKLMRLGLYHTESVFFIYVIQAALITFAFIFRFYSDWLLLGFYLLFSGAIFTWVLWANKTGYQLMRPGRFDRLIKNNLRIFKIDNALIRVSFTILEMVLPVLLVFSVFVPGEIPVYISAAALVFVILIFITVHFKKWSGGILRVPLFLMIPYLIYMGETDLALWAASRITGYMNIVYVALAFFVVLTIKYTRRTKGFKASPMDFIILFAALVIPNLPDPRIEGYNLGIVAIKIIVFSFSFEVWICELRGRLAKVKFSAAAALIALAARGLL
ncbi:MAG: undecaprenyl/decaprenyl-phosphate alpha-N-acetylglucosaminyl 1-phosphate transferase [Deltaproteobacteria bacterium]|nr:undecaprenyl/decaprenyl-phosphate alpha-N-acetylglucosaminyl 1-phosphate transferase [Deltaproteobacteria bacterium]